MLLKNIVAAFIAVFVFGVVAIAQSPASDESVTVGTIEKIDPAAKTITVKSHDDVVTAFKWTGKVVAHGVKEAAIWTGHEAHVGTHVVVHAVKVAGVDTIKAVEWFGKGTAKVVKGTARYIGSSSKKIGIAVAGGAEEVYDVSSHAMVVTGKAIGHGTKIAAKDTAKAAVVTAHVFESGGKKFIHFIEHAVE